MKRYLVFIGDIYYPIGGMEDFSGDFDTLPECQKAIEKIFLERYDRKYSEMSPAEYIESDVILKWAHIYDTVARLIIWDSEKHSLYRNDLISEQLELREKELREQKLPEDSLI